MTIAPKGRPLRTELRPLDTIVDGYVTDCRLTRPGDLEEFPLRGRRQRWPLDEPLRLRRELPLCGDRRKPIGAGIGRAQPARSLRPRAGHRTFPAFRRGRILRMRKSGFSSPIRGRTGMRPRSSPVFSTRTDTSSDELAGHYLAWYRLQRTLVADAEERLGPSPQPAAPLPTISWTITIRWSAQPESAPPGESGRRRFLNDDPELGRRARPEFPGDPLASQGRDSSLRRCPQFADAYQVSLSSGTAMRSIPCVKKFCRRGGRTTTPTTNSPPAPTIRLLMLEIRSCPAQPLPAQPRKHACGLYVPEAVAFLQLPLWSADGRQGPAMPMLRCSGCGTRPGI